MSLGIIELDEVVARLSAIEARLAKIEEYLRPADMNYSIPALPVATDAINAE